MNDETKIVETEGFIIVYNNSETPKKPKSCADDLPRPVEQIPDWMLSANSSTEYKTHLLAPVYKDGKTTGQWRVYFYRDKQRDCLISPRKIPWDRQFEGRDEAEDWIASILHEIRNKK